MNNELIYLDTNLYIDYFENRSDRLRPLGEFVYVLLRKIIECEYKLAISSLVIDELELNNRGEKIKELIAEFKTLNKIVCIEQSCEDVKTAVKIKRQRKTPLNDTKHAVIAKRAKARFLVTRNIKDFVELQALIEIRYPESL